MKRLSAVLVAIAAVVGVAVPAHAADDLASGSWYFENGHVQDAHDAGFRGEGVTVAVIDSQINPGIAALRGADLEIVEPSFCLTADGAEIPTVSTDPDVSYHGTGVASMIVGTGATDPGQLPLRGVAPDAKVRYYSGAAGTAAESDAGELKCYDESGENGGMDGVGRAIDAAVSDGADIVSISIGGGVSGVVTKALARAYAAGVVVVTSLPNEHGGVDTPSGNNGVVAVQAFDEAVEIQKGDKGIEGGPLTPNTSQYVVVGAPGLGILLPAADPEWQQQRLGGGTSFAAPIVAGFLAVVKSKFPEATGNQLIQTMLHNTNAQTHEPQWGNDLGYGAISLTSMLADDPLSYPDENPLFDSPQFELNSVVGPTADDVSAATREDSEATPTASPTAQAVEPVDGSAATGAPWWPWAAGAVVVVVLGAAVAVIVMNNRGRRSKAAAVAPADAQTTGGNDE